MELAQGVAQALFETMAILDDTNLAHRGGLAGQQWVSNAYLLALGSLILVGGSLGDLFGERRVSMRINIDRSRLAGYKLTVQDVEDAIRRQNAEIPAGRIESNARDFTLRVARSYQKPEDFAQIPLGVVQVRLNDDAGMRPIAKLRLGEKRFEKLERRVFVRVAFHVEINESADLSRAAQKWSQLGREMGNSILWIRRVYLRIERRNFD